jgi:hypothetical protein
VTGLKAGTVTITAAAGTVTKTVEVTVTGSTVKTVDRFEIEGDYLPIGYEGQVPNISKLSGKVWWNDGTMTQLTDANLRALGFTTKPGVFAATEGDINVTTTSVYIFHKDRPMVTVEKKVQGIHPLVTATSAANLVPDLSGKTFADMAKDGRANAYGYRSAKTFAEWFEDEQELDLSAIEVTAYYLPFTSTTADLKFQAIQTFKLGPEYVYTNYDPSIGKTPLGSSPADLAVDAKKYDYGIEPLAKADVKDKLQGYVNVLISGSEDNRNSIKNLSLPIEKYYWVRNIVAEPITWKNPDSDAKDLPYWYEDNVTNNKPGTTGLPASPKSVTDRLSYWTNTALNSGIQVRVYYEGTEGILDESKLRTTDYVRRAVNRGYAGIQNPSQNEGAGLPDFTQLEEGEDYVYLNFTYYPDNLAIKPTGGYYENVAKLLIPLATFNEEVAFVRKKLTANETPVKFYASRADPNGNWHQTLQDTWKLVGIYTAPNGDRVERDIDSAKWANATTGAVRIQNWTEVTGYDDPTPTDVKLEAQIVWEAGVLGTPIGSGNIMYGQIYNGVGNDNTPEPTVQANQ